MSAETTIESALARSPPKCAIRLATSALVFHCVAFVGNLNVAWTVESFGHAANGWSTVGLGFAHSLATDLDGRLINTSTALTQTIDALQDLREAVHEAAEAAAEDGSLASPSSGTSLSQQPGAGAHDVLADHFQRLMDLLQPALLQVQQWLKSFGPELRAGATDLTTALDVVQKILDTATSNLQAVHDGNTSFQAKEALLSEAFNLFDVSNTGAVSREDLKNIASIYGVQALVGEKADRLVDEYEHGLDASPGVSPEEFELLVDDDGLPGVLTLVVRSYARRLAQTSRRLSAARRRDEVAESVTAYLATVTVENNASKINSILGHLTDGGLPVEFTADVLAQLAMAADNPESLTTVDVGALALDAMVKLSPERVTEATNRLSDAAFWASEGFDPEQQARCVDRVAGWIANATGGEAASALLLQLLSGANHSEGPGANAEVGESELEARGGDGVEEASLLQRHVLHGHPRSSIVLQEEILRVQRQPTSPRAHAAARAADGGLCLAASLRVEETRKQVALQRLSDQASRARQRRLIAGSNDPLAALAGALMSPGFNPDAKRAVGAGVQARPETLAFAANLSAAASEQAKRYEHLCFDYSASSSGAVESAAQIVEGMITRFTAFLQMVEKFASPRAIEKFEASAGGIVDSLRSGSLGRLALAQPASTRGRRRSVDVDWSFAVDFINEVDAALPAWIDALKMARTEVLQVSATMESLFNVVQMKAPPIFYLVSDYFVQIITAYLFIFVVVTLLNLAYALWASRMCQQDDDGEEHDAPQSFGAKLCDCCRTCWCGICCKGCDSHEYCFWSAILLMEILWLVLFLTTIVFMIIFGVRAFMGAGCKPIYLLGDDGICGDRLAVVGGFLQNTSWAFTADDMASACSDNNMLVCQMIRHKLYVAMLVSVLGNFLAAAVTWLLIVESAALHERRHRCMLMTSAIAPGKHQD